ncbi:MAG TPA: adenosine deaminase, partial [Actinomycetes bacterium]|nr:adenosine deaminase [Actinomycetes bacterium]
VIANAVPRLELHPYRRMREAGLLATLNTDDPALTDLDLGREYLSVMLAFDFAWDDMVQISVDGVEATWLDEDAKRTLAARVEKEGAELRTAIES